MKSDSIAKGNVKYLRSLNYRNIRDADSLKNCLKICAYLDDRDLILSELEMSKFWGQKYCIYPFKVGE